MKKGNRVIAGQAVLALMAFVLLLVVAASAVRSRAPASASTSTSDEFELTTLPDADKTSAPTDLLRPNAGPNAGSDAGSDAGSFDQQRVGSSVFTGTVIKHGPDLMLRDRSGKLYRFDTPSKAIPFQGKSVRVAGNLQKDGEGKLARINTKTTPMIHVVVIVSAIG